MTHPAKFNTILMTQEFHSSVEQTVRIIIVTNLSSFCWDLIAYMFEAMQIYNKSQLPEKNIFQVHPFVGTLANAKRDKRQYMVK